MKVSKYFKTADSFAMLELDDYGTVSIGDDMRINGMDSPARIRVKDVPAFIAWLESLKSEIGA